MKIHEHKKIGEEILKNIQRYKASSNPTNSENETKDIDYNLYTLAVQAYIYCFPWLYLSQLQWLWTSEAGKKIQGEQAIHASMNSFWYAPKLASPGTSTGGSPNTDTFYSIAWCNLSKEPLVLSVPEINDRYYCIELSGIDSDTYGYVGSRATGTAAGNYLLVGPNWNGSVDKYNEKKLPKDRILDVLPVSFYPDVLLLGRTGITSGTSEDLNQARKLQFQYRLTSLSDWVNGTSNSEAPKALFAYSSNDNPSTDNNFQIGAWDTINKAMTQSPPGVFPSIAQNQLIEYFAQIGIGPNQDIKNQSPQNLALLQKAAIDGLEILKKKSGEIGTMVNGWMYPPTYYGKAGQVGDYLTRASLQALGGITAHWTIEAVYLNTAVDSDNQPLSGSEKYSIKFTENSFPPFESNFHGFWSITMYQNNYNLVANSENYTINSNEHQYRKLNDDKGMEILIQQDDPGKLPNGTYWLQSPAASDSNDGFYMILRVYIPAPSVATTQTWIPPSVVKTS